jgi:hypothetical protein
MAQAARVRKLVAAQLALAALAGASVFVGPAQAETRLRHDPYSIMAPEPGTRSTAAPEPWLSPKYRSPHGLRQRPHAARPHPPVRGPSVHVVRPAPPIVLPNGQVVPNLPPVRRGIVPGGGTETFSDRASRCATQSALNNVPGDQKTTYMHSCTMGR